MASGAHRVGQEDLLGAMLDIACAARDLLLSRCSDDDVTRVRAAIAQGTLTERPVAELESFDAAVRRIAAGDRPTPLDSATLLFELLSVDTFYQAPAARWLVTSARLSATGIEGERLQHLIESRQLHNPEP